ncbi:MAG: glutathione S-transferase N-terminal domain-containing protein [Hyphomicrobiales bacterium]|nr:glutathione S-transferase N-terminal domain-containing protein [Hyphomicrobiales bacterium]
MLLRTSITSPFGRKTRIAALRLDLMDRIEVVHGDTLDPKDPLRGDNPLGKIPVLILDDGRRVFDSRVILEYFDHLAGGGRILPANPDERLDALRLQALADGLMDAAILVVYEVRYRPEDGRHQGWVDMQKEKMTRALKAMGEFLPPPDTLNVGTIAAGCALAYIDWRKQVDWRSINPSLVAWFEAFQKNVPEFGQTQPEE